MTNSTSDREQRLKEIHLRWDGNLPYAPPLEICKRDIDFLLSLIDSEAAGGEETPDQVWVEFLTQHAFTVKPEPYIETVEYLRKATVNAHYEDLMRATLLREESAATRMRDLCVEKLRGLLEREVNGHSRGAYQRAVVEMQSLTLDNQQPVKEESCCISALLHSRQKGCAETAGAEMNQNDDKAIFDLMVGWGTTGSTDTFRRSVVGYVATVRQEERRAAFKAGRFALIGIHGSTSPDPTHRKGFTAGVNAAIQALEAAANETKGGDGDDG